MPDKSAVECVEENDYDSTGEKRSYIRSGHFSL